jgi:hypothetical protein
MIITATAGEAAIPIKGTSCVMITPVAAMTNRYVPKNSTAKRFSIGVSRSHYVGISEFSLEFELYAQR